VKQQNPLAFAFWACLVTLPFDFTPTSFEHFFIDFGVTVMIAKLLSSLPFISGDHASHGMSVSS
jgi:hypothetical protein